jgi:hypothetical protein
MNKEKLITFIEKYHLNDSIPSVKMVSDGTTLKTAFVAEDKTLAGNVTFNDAKLEKCELGVFDTARFKSFLKILGDDIKIVLNKVDDRLVGLLISDDNTEVNFMLSDLSVIPVAPKVKDIKIFDVEIPIDAAFVERFTKAKSVLPDVDSFTLLMNKKGDKLELVIGYASINSNRIKVEIKATPGKDKLEKPISFNANYFKEILLQNRDATGAIFKVQAAGIAYIAFTTPEFEANYYLIKKEIEG